VVIEDPGTSRILYRILREINP